jgi:hypothetical protein
MILLVVIAVEISGTIRASGMFGAIARA